MWDQDLEEGVPFFWGADPEGRLVFSEDSETVKKGCGKSFAVFPKGHIVDHIIDHGVNHLSIRLLLML